MAVRRSLLPRPGSMLLLWGVALAGCGGRASETPADAADRVGTVRFARDLGGAVVPGPVIAADGSVLAASNAGVLHALDPATGKDRWRFDGGAPYGSDLSTSPLQLPDGTILWPGPRDQLFAVGADGRLRWSVKLGAMGTTPARAPDGTVVVQDVRGVLHALSASAREGHERWRIRAGARVSYASAAIGRNGAFLTTVGDQLVSVRDRGTLGSVAWRFRARADIEVSPAVGADGTIVLGTNDAYEYGISPTGKERWRFRREIFTYSSPVATPDGKVRFGDHRGRLITLDAATGRLLRIDHGHGQVWGAPAVGRDGTVVFTGHPGEVFGLDERGRRILHVAAPGPIDATPAIGPEGTVYVGSEDGTLFALQPGRRTP